MQLEPSIAFVADTRPTPALEIRVNFGMLASREATNAEIDELARVILTELTEVTIVAEQRHEFSTESESVVHQVRIEVAAEHLPADASELTARLVHLAERWARACFERGHPEISEY